MKSEPDKLSSIRERKKSLLIERKNKLAEFDIYGYFKITGEELMRPSWNTSQILILFFYYLNSSLFKELILFTYWKSNWE